jgi:CMP-N-acetylneuraminic acid synthetase
MVSRVAIIPARGGSKRLPRKNILPFMGRPMIAWTVDAAWESRLFDRVVVSTDDEEIAEVARECGADVPFLRGKHADDNAPVSLATVTTLVDMIGREGKAYDVVAQLMANCPLRSAADIRLAMAAFEAAGVDFQISCTNYGWLNPWWAVQLDELGRPGPIFPDAIKARSQDLPTIYCPTGAIWLANAKRLIETGTFYGPGHRFEPMSWKTSVDIDDSDDMNFALAVHATKFTVE